MRITSKYSVDGLGTWLSGLGVILGAFGAHAMKARLSESSLETFHTATHYLVIHALAILMLEIQTSAVEPDSWAEKRAHSIAMVFLLGILAFSGSLYLYIFSELKFLVFVTPLGGTLLILGWFLWALSWKKIRK